MNTASALIVSEKLSGAILKARLPKDFGDENGSEISNKDTIFSEIDKALGVSKPPALEYILVMPFSSFFVPFLGFGINMNAYGHAAVRYTLPDGRGVVMNVEGKKDKRPMIQFSSPENYIYGTKYSGGGQEQRGCYNRAMISVRIESVPDEDILNMHNYFCTLQSSAVQEISKFNIIFGPLSNFLRKCVPFEVAERGNCAFWTSKGLKEARVLSSTSMWPKSLWIHLFENTNMFTDKKKNVHVVSYRRIKHATLSYGVDAEAVTAVAPLQSLRSIFYWNLERFANAIVEVPETSLRAVVRPIPDAVPPSPIRNLVNNWGVILLSVVVTGVLISRQSRVFESRVSDSLYRWQQRRHSKKPVE